MSFCQAIGIIGVVHTVGLNQTQRVYAANLAVKQCRYACKGWEKETPKTLRVLNGRIVIREQAMTKKQSLLPAIILILLGLWFLAGNFGLSLPNLAQLWPGFIMLGGAMTLWSWFSGKNPDSGQIFTGLLGLGVGAFFFLFTLNLRLPVLGRVSWNDMNTLWPGFLLIGGGAWVGQFILSGFKGIDRLVFGLLAMGLSALGFAFTLGFLSQTLGKQLLQFWPLILIFLGLGLFFSRRR